MPTHVPIYTAATDIQSKDDETRCKIEEIKHLNENIQLLNENIQSKDNEIRCKVEKIKHLHDNIQSKNDDIRCRGVEIQCKWEEIQRKDEKIHQQDENIRQQNEDIQRKDEEIRQLCADAVSKAHEISEQNAAIRKGGEELQTYKTSTKKQINSFDREKIIMNAAANDRESKLAALHTEKEQLSQDVSTLKASAEADNKRLNDLESRIREKDGRIHQLDHELETFESAVQNKDERIRQLDHEFAILKSAVQDKDGRIRQMEHELETLESAVRGKDGHIRQLNQDISTAQSDLASKEDKISHCNDEIQRLGKEIDEIQNVAQQNITESEMRYSAQLTRETEQASAKYDAAIQSQQALIEERKKLTTKVHTLRAAQESQARVSRKYEVDNEQLRRDNKSMTKQLASTQSDNRRYKKTVQSLQSQVDDATRSTTEAKRELEAMRLVRQRLVDVTVALGLPPDRDDVTLKWAHKLQAKAHKLKEDLEVCEGLSTDRADCLRGMDGIVGALHRTAQWATDNCRSIPMLQLDLATRVARLENHDDRFGVLNEFKKIHSLKENHSPPSNGKRMGTPSDHIAKRMRRASNESLDEAEDVDDGLATSTIKNGGHWERTLEQLGIGALPNILEVLNAFTNKEE